MMNPMSILSGRARVAGIAGWPVDHSRSPRIHGFWLRRHAIDGAYVPLPVPPDAFGRAMRVDVSFRPTHHDQSDLIS